MKKFFLTAATLFAAIIFSQCGAELPSSNSDNVSKKYSFDNFTGLSVANGFDVELVQSDKFSVETVIPAEYYEYLNVANKKGTLVVGFKKLPVKLSNFKRSNFKLRVSMPAVSSVILSGASILNAKGEFCLMMGEFHIECSGASRIEALNIKGPRAVIESSGASNISLDANVSDMEADVSGASKLKMKGAADEVKVDISGASGYDGSDMQAKCVDIDASGASKAVIYVLEKLKVELSGASSCQYSCPGEIAMDIRSISGASSLKKK